MKVGSTYKGLVTGIKPYGAFVQLEDETIGLVHISEIKTGYIDDIYKELTMGQEVTVQVIDFDEYTQKASFSMRSLENDRHFPPHRNRFSKSHYKIGFKPLKDNLPIWLEEGVTYLKTKTSQDR